MILNRYKNIQKVHLIILLVNAATSISKLLVGYITNSASITADGFHSMTDGLNNVIGMIGAYFAFQPIDKKHPYGHRKFETMTTLFISFLLILTSVNLLRGAYSRILDPITPTITPLSFIVMVASILINIFVTIFEKRKGKALKSDFLILDATHTLSDVFVSITVMGTLIAVKLGYPFLDAIVSIFIALVIAKAGIDIIKNVTNILCDAVVLDPEDISNVVCEFDEVYSCHKIRSRGRDDDIHIDLHVVAISNMTLEDAHLLVHNIDSILKNRFPGVSDVDVHVDPLEYYKEKNRLT